MDTEDTVIDSFPNQMAEVRILACRIGRRHWIELRLYASGPDGSMNPTGKFIRVLERDVPRVVAGIESAARECARARLSQSRNQSATADSNPASNGGESNAS